MEMKSAMPRDRAYTDFGPSPSKNSTLHKGDQQLQSHINDKLKLDVFNNSPNVIEKRVMRAL